MSRAWRFFGLAAALFLWTSIQPARAQFFLTDTTIDAGDTNYDGDDIVVFGCTLTINGSHTFSDLLVTGGGEVTHSPCTNGLYDETVPGGLNLVISNNLVVDAGSSINADGLNFGVAGKGASVTTTSPFGVGDEYTSGGGAGHGGYGGASLGGAAGGAVYGNYPGVTNLEMGSTGGTGFAPGGPGGGLVRLQVSGVALVDGMISANGADGTNSGSGGGSGGGISISAEALAGAGEILTRGGGGDPTAGGGGGGGRIVVTCQTNGFTGSFSAAGGPGIAAGGAGTVYVNDNAGSFLLVDNGGLAGTNTPINVNMARNLDLQVSGGAVAVSTDLNNFPIANLLIGSNSWLTAAPQLNYLSLPVSGDVTIQSGGGISMDGHGLTNGNFLGFYAPTTGVAGGGGNAGEGGGPGAGGIADRSETVTSGSSGASDRKPGSTGGLGGGIVFLDVAGTLRLDGIISANGEPGTGLNAGGGSGGAVVVTNTTMLGSGVFSAVGGAGAPPLAGGGGGGEIQITSQSNQFTGAYEVHGGNGTYPGGAGFAEFYSNRVWDVIIDNGGLAGAVTPLPELSPTDLTITGGAVVAPPGDSATVSNLVIGPGGVLTLGGAQFANIQWIASNVEIEAGGAVLLEGVSESSLSQTATTAEYDGILTGGGGANSGDGGRSIGGADGGVALQDEGEQITGGKGGNGAEQATGGLGGGYLSFVVAKNLIVNGLIDVDGAPGVALGSGGGAGGTIAVSAQGFSGAGTFSADGGDGEAFGGGGGGGGRISITCTSNQFTGVMTAYGGDGFQAGGAGIISVSTGQFGPSKLLVDNNGLVGAATPWSGIGIGETTSDLTVANGAELTLNNSPELNLRNFLIGSNAVVTIATNVQGSEAARVNVDGSAAILPTGAIFLDGSGFSANTGPGAGHQNSTSNIITGSGAGNGGYGGSSATGVAGGNAVEFYPANSQPGSGGGGLYGGRGGGGLSLTVVSNLEIDGIITANGLPSVAQSGGGGAGGSIAVSAKLLFGGGFISANGGSGNLPLGGGGAGGQINISVTSNLFTGPITAYGGAGAMYGGAGIISIGLKSVQVANSQLILDNGGHMGTNTPLGQISGNLVIANGAIATANASATLNSLLITSNALLIPSAAAPALWTASSVTIQPGGAISADGLGLQGGLGAGANRIGANQINAGSGGGYGGYGGRSGTGAPGGNVYGSVSFPLSTGSVGGIGSGFPDNGGFAGGVVDLTVNGVLNLGGTISANGLSGRGICSGGGSGGSIVLHAGILAGQGVVSANGGAGGLPLGGGGGGGRIAVSAISNAFTGTYSAHGGTGFAAGGPGTIYLPAAPNGNSLAQVILDNGGLSGTGAFPLTTSLPTYNLSLRGGASLFLVGEANFGNVSIGSNSFLRPYSNGVLNLDADTLTIQAGGGIDFDNASTAALPGILSPPSPVILCGPGGGNGGSGGASGNGLAGAPAMGSILEPTTPGSFGGYDTLPGVFTPGGGVVTLKILNLSTIDGSITVNGASATNGEAGGGGGGSIYLTTQGFAGSGLLSANGGSGQLPYGGGGGGGRIAVYATSNEFAGHFSAAGGTGFMAGGAGTIYQSRIQGLTASLTLDNGGVIGANTPLSSLGGQGEAPEPDLHITGGAVAVPTLSLADTTSSSILIQLHSFLIDSNATLTQVTGGAGVDLIVYSNATIAATGSISVDDKGELGGGLAPGEGSWDSSGGGGGGGYGGRGADSILGGKGGLSYGSSNSPIDLGSGGGLPAPNVGLSDGGGAIQLEVTKTLTVNGSISANGESAQFPGAGGGSGGSIWLAVDTLVGSGSIAANGGAGDLETGGGGGGGRIAIYYVTNEFAGPLSANGGPGNFPGQNGTLVLSTNASPKPLAVEPAQLGADMEATAGQLTLRWAGSGELTYQLQCSTNLIDWVPCGAPIVGSNGLMNVSPARSGPAEFFRVISRN